MYLFKSTNGKTQAIIFTSRKMNEAKEMVKMLADAFGGGYKQWDIVKLPRSIKKEIAQRDIELDALYEEAADA